MVRITLAKVYISLIIRRIGLDDICQKMEEGTYSLLGKDNTLKYSLSKKPIFFKEEEATLIIIREFSSIEKFQENKCKELLISTMTHDIKTPLTIIQGNLALLNDFVLERGMQHFKAVFAATETLEYHLYDIIVNGFKF